MTKDYSLITDRLGLQLKSTLSADRNHNLIETYFVYADDLLKVLEQGDEIYSNQKNSLGEQLWTTTKLTGDKMQGFVICKHAIREPTPNPVTREELTAINERLAKWGVK